LPQAVDPQQARAEYRHGTCRIHLPKRHPPGPTAEHAVVAVEGERYVLRKDVS
jgi:HSP20 family molecular chaperone IbpA